MAAFYRATLANFIGQAADEILGSLLRCYQHNELQKRQTKAWQVEIRLLKITCEEVIHRAPAAVTWSLLLE